MFVVLLNVIVNRSLTEKQIEKATAAKQESEEKEPKEVKPLIREDENEPIKLDLQLGSKRAHSSEAPAEAIEEGSNQPEKLPKLETNEQPTNGKDSPPQETTDSSNTNRKNSTVQKMEISAKAQKISVS